MILRTWVIVGMQALVGVLALAGCVGELVAPDEDLVSGALPADPRTAAAYYRAMAMEADSPAREAYQLSAAQALVDSGALREAAALLATVEVAPLDDGLILRKQVLSARIALAENRPADAAGALAPLESLRVTPAQRAPALVLRAQAYEVLHDPLRAAYDRAHAAPYLGAVEAADNHGVLLRLLRTMDTVTLDQELERAGSGIYGSWVELARALAVPAERAQRLALWQARYPRHPGLALLQNLPAATAAAAAPDAAISLPDAPIEGSVAVLLPLDTRLQAVAQAVLDGVQAQHGNDAGTPLSVQVYRSNDADDIAAVYQRALAEGARAVIGPLRKEDVTRLLQSGVVSVPTLALNNPEPPLQAANLYMLSLDPADEIEAAQAMAWNAGLRRAAVLYPRDAWGGRMFELMRDAWQARGGTIGASQSYEPQARDYTDAVRGVLEVAAGEARSVRIGRLIGTPVAFRPGPSASLDVVFLAASAPQARLLQPQLRYFGAGALPVYATSQVWGGGANPQDSDLEGVVFCDTPQTLAPEPTDPATQGAGLDRVYALGADAYLVLRHLHELGSGATLRGRTGVLELGPDRRIHRTLQCGMFRGGRVVPADTGAQGPL